MTTPAFAEQPVLLVLGDSLSAGHGIEQGDGWVALLQQRLRQRTPAYRVVNASISGDTTSSALARLPAILKRDHPDVAVVELGGNDGLRGLSLAAMHDNLGAILAQLRREGTKVLLLGVRLPPNYGPVFLKRFRDVYQQLAEQYQVPLVPHFLAGVADNPALMQDDGIHPRAAGQARLLANVWPEIELLLRSAD